MNLKRMGAVTLARSIEFMRDRAALSWNLIVPLFLVVGLAWIFSGPGQPLFKVAVLTADGVPLTAATHPFLAAPAVRFYREADEATARAKVQRHRIDLALDLRGKPGRYFINPASQKGAALEIMLRGDGGTDLQKVTADGASIRYVDWAAPGVLGMNLMFSCLFGIGYVIVRYRKSGYLKRLSATPLSAAEFIVAQMLSRLALVLVVTILVYIGCNLLLHFRMEGSYALLFLVLVVGAFSMIAMGLLVSARVASEELAGGILNLISSPMMVLSGVFFSLDGAPPLVQWLSQAFPLTHILQAVRAIMLDGAGLVSIEVYRPLLILGISSVVFTTLGAKGFKWTRD